MDFDFTEEQTALQDSLARMLAARHDHETWREIAHSDSGFSEALWEQLADLGVTALPVPEAHCGLGGSALDLLVVFQELGRSLLASPLLGSCVLPAVALRAAGGGVADQWLPALASGGSRIAWAHDEPEGDGSHRWVGASAVHGEGEWRLTGRKLAVAHGASANAFLVTARVGDQERALFLVARDAAGLDVRAHRLIDMTPAAELRLDDVVARRVDGDGGKAIQTTLAIAVVCACAEMLGCMEAAFRLTVDYLNTRKQFGRVIGQNQALRHKLADMQVSLEVSRSMTYAAASTAEQADGWLDLHRAKLLVGRQARALAQNAIQMHGGIGMTEEYAVGNYLRRIHVLDLSFGDTVTHAAALAELQRCR